MKLITAVIQPHTLDAVGTALKAVEVRGMTVSEADGFGRQKGHTEIYRGAEYTVDLVPKKKVEVLAEDADVSAIIEAIIAATQSGTIGDGKIWVTTVDEVIRVRTGATGSEAL